VAIYPCDQHGSRYSGRQRTAYPAIVNGQTSMRRKRRLCLSCFAELADFCEKAMVPADVSGEPGECMTCASHDTSYAVFVTLYPDGDERHDYYGRACKPCAGDAVAMALFGQQATF
jgi:hypothetical protein